METKYRKVIADRNAMLPRFKQWFDEAKVPVASANHLLSALAGLLQGRDPTPSFKLYGSSDKEVVEKFLKSLDWADYRVPQGWKDYEFDRLSKFGPQGGYHKWEEVKPLFDLYFERPQGVVKDNYFYESDKIMKQRFNTISCSMLGVNETLASLLATKKIEERAAGCRFFDLKKTDKLAQQYAIQDFRSGLSKKFFSYVFLKWYKQKNRIFMPGPYSIMLDQARFFVPFLKEVKADITSKGIESAFVSYSEKLGFDTCFKLMNEEFEKADKIISPDQSTDLYVQGDFEKMDTTEGPSQYSELYIPYIKTAFRFSKSNTIIDESYLQTVTNPIATPDGMRTGNHGTASGMENTNDGESCSNLHYCENWWLRLKQKWKTWCAEVPKKDISILRISIRVNGDDSSIVIRVHSKDPAVIQKLKELIQESAEEAAKSYGFRINEKWRIDTEFGLYCQNAFWRDKEDHIVRYMYPSSLILNSILNPLHEYTRATWDKSYRDIDIAEKLDNGANLPYFKELVHYVDNGMKFRFMGRSEPETRRILSAYERYRALQPLDERYNRQDWHPSKSPSIRLRLSEMLGDKTDSILDEPAVYHRKSTVSHV